MSALSIRHKDFTMQRNEHIRNTQNAAWYASLPEEVKVDRTHYWWLERKAKHGKGWIKVRRGDLYMTKSEVAVFWCKHYRGKKEFRLRHWMKF